MTPAEEAMQLVMTWREEHRWILRVRLVPMWALCSLADIIAGALARRR